jgi:tetratricopeptide (TPR) repeat protein
MMALALFLICQFDARYQVFLQSPRSEAIFVGLTQGRYSINDFSNDPVVLWFWRNRADDPKADSLLKRINMRRNFYLSAVTRWEAIDADYETAMNKLNLASHFDSAGIENFLSFIVLAVKKRSLEPVLAAFSLPVFSDFRTQIFMITNGAVLIFLAIFMCAFIYVVTKTIRYLPMVSHRLDPQEHNRFKGIMGLAFMLFPVLVFRNLYLILISYMILLLFVLNTRERNWLRLSILSLVVIFIFSLPLKYFVDFLTTQSRYYSIYEMVNYDIKPKITANSESDKIFLAYAYKQQGELEKAMSLYEDMYYKGHREIAVVNNLANIYLLYGEEARAETLYAYAMHADDRGEPFFNMGLVRLKNLEYSESSRFMNEAVRRKFSSSSSEPIDIMPTTGDYYGVILSEPLKVFGIINPAFVFILVVIFVLTFLPFRFPAPFYCSICGRAVCRNCQAESEEEVMCKECFAKLKSTDNVEMEALLKHSVSVRKRRTGLMIAYLVNFVVPGAGLIYLGRNLVGIVVVFIVMLSYTPLLFSHLFIKPAGWVSLSLTPLFIAAAVLVAFLTYLYSFSAIRGSYGD